MKKLRKLLSEQAKGERHRRHQINIHIALLGWVSEFSGFLVVVLGSYILGHGSVIVTLTLQTLTIFMMFNVVPCVYLINDNDMKARIAESKNYFNFLRFFKLEKNNVVDVVDDEVVDDVVVEQIDNELNSKHSNVTDDT